MPSPPTYPSAPPFPHQATHNIAQANAVAGPDEQEIVTLIRDGVHRMQTKGDQYLAGYTPNGVSRGGVVALHGAHGAGKTHAIWFVMHHLESQRPRFSVDPVAGSLCQVYAKIDGPDPMQLYRSIMSQIGLPQLRELSRAFLAVVAAEQGVGDGDQKKRSEVKRHLRESPEFVESLFDSYRLEAGAVREGGAHEIEKIGEAWRGFERAITGLRKAKLAEVAHRWIGGEVLSAADLDRLGVGGSIDTPDMALLGLRIVARLFRRAEVPFAIYIDQIEGLVLGGEEQLMIANRGLVRSILEVLPQEGAFLVIAGNMEAWRAYPLDMKQRFAEGPLFLPALTEPEAADLIIVYQSPFKSALASREESLYPFSEEAVHELLRFGGGNVRRFLQNCSLVFNEAFQSHAPIDAALVQTTLESTAATSFDKAGVLAQVRRLLSGRGLAVAENVEVGGVTVDFAVISAAGAPVGVVKLNEAIFRSQEAGDVRETLELVRRTKSTGDVIHVILIVLGYVSPDMTEILEQVADDTIVYTTDSFEALFLDAVSRIPEAGAASGSGEASILNNRIDELQKALTGVLQQRRSDDERLQAQVEALFRRQDAERREAARDEARTTWVVERSRLEKEIREARAARARVDVDELERSRVSAEGDRLRRQRKTIVLSAIVAALLLVLVLSLVVDKSKLVIAAGLLAVALVVVGVFAWRELNELRRRYPSDLRELTEEVDSEEELRKLAAGQAHVLERHLRSPYPQFRYAAALSIAEQGAPAADQLARALRKERSTIVQRALARSLGAVGGVNRSFCEGHSLLGVPELVYAAEVARTDPHGEMPRSYEAVRALSRQDEGLFLSITLEQQLADVTVMKLAEAFRRGVERLGPMLLSDQIPDRSLRAAVEFLSPFDSGGLGTFDQLGVITAIDEWYLFLREMQWFSSHGWVNLGS
jgi:hypothetical protein